MLQKIKKILLIIAALLIVGGGFLVYVIYQNIRSVDNTTATGEPVDGSVERKLDGVKVAPGQEDFLPVAVMIENHFDARPQSGLVEAKIVYEVLTEGLITRFLAIYDLSENVAAIGPVRSARPYFMELAGEYDGFYVHSGGSPAALELLKSYDQVEDLNEFFGYNTGYFWRDDKRSAPHNLYTSTELLTEAKTQYGLPDKTEFEMWRFKDDGAPATTTQEIKVDYSVLSTYHVVWKYKSGENNYERWQNEQPHTDSAGQFITAKNIIIQFARSKDVDDIGRKEITLTGKGKAMVFRDGEAIEGYWQKEEGWHRTRFYDNNGQEIQLNRGNTWVEIVPDFMEISF